MGKIIAVIPAYNEAERIAEVIRGARPHVDTVIVVDDGSSDQTRGVAERCGGGVVVLRHGVNLGKGSALKTGCEAALMWGAEIIVMLDADGQHPPDYIPRLVNYLEDRSLDVVFGMRESHVVMPFIRSFGNTVLNTWATILFNVRVHDIWCGFRVVRSDALPHLWWHASDYSGEIQMVLNVGRYGFMYGEYPIPTVYHDRTKGVHILHGLKVLAQMAVWRIFS